MKSKIVKKKDLDVLIENTMVKAGLKESLVESTNSSEKKEEQVKEISIEKIVKESTTTEKSLINEEFKSELEKFNKLSNFKY
jgi:hypothetical protein